MYVRVESTFVKCMNKNTKVFRIYLIYQFYLYNFGSTSKILFSVCHVLFKHPVYKLNNKRTGIKVHFTKSLIVNCKLGIKNEHFDLFNALNNNKIVCWLNMITSYVKISLECCRYFERSK